MRRFGVLAVVVALGAALLVAAGVPGLTAPARAGAKAASGSVAQSTSSYGGIDPVMGDYRGLRNRTSDTYPDPNGHGFRTVISAQAVNYRGASGAWQPINDTLVADSANGSAYRNQANSYTVHLPDSLAQPLVFTSGGSSVALSLVGGGGSPVTTSGTTAYYAEAMPDVDVAYSAGPDGLSESLTLKNPSAPASFTYALSTAGGLTPHMIPAGGIVFLDASGAVQLSIPAPVAWDASGAASVSDVAASYGLSSDGRTIVLSVDPGWLAAGRAWPVTVDPGITNNTALTCNLLKAAPTTSYCGATTLNVGYDGTNSTRSITTFDLSSVPHVSDVFTASLAMYVDTHSNSTNSTVGAYQLTRPYTSAATWNTYDGTHAWTTAGGDYSSLGGYSLSNLGTAGSSYDWFPTQLVQGWVDGTIANDGVMLKEPTESTITQLDFWSSTASTPVGEDPQLYVAWQPRVGLLPYYTQLSQSLSDRMKLNINPATGNMELDATDLQEAGTNGQNLSIHRYANSLYTGGGYFDWEAADGWCSMGTDEKFTADEFYGAQQGGGDLIGPDCYDLALPTNSDTGSLITPSGLDLSYAKIAGNDTLTFNRTGEKVTFDSTYGTEQPSVNADKNGDAILYDRSTGAYPPSPVKITDTQGRLFPWTWDGGDDDVTGITDSTGGRTLTYNYGSGGSPFQSYTDANNKTTQYAYNASNILNKITDPLGNETTMIYDATGRITSMTRVTNNVTGAGYTWGFSYHQDANDAAGYTVVTDPLSHTTTYYYDTKSRVTKVIDGDGGTVQGSFTTNNDPLTLTDALSPGNVWNLTWNANNVPTKIQAPLTSGGGSGRAIGLGYPTSGFVNYPTSMTDPQSNVTNYTYGDTAGNLTQSVDALGSGNTVTAGYQGDTGVPSCTTGAAKGLICVVTDKTNPNDPATNYTYDANGNLTKVAPVSGTGGIGATVITPDVDSRVRTSTDGKAQKNTYSYDPLDRVTQILFGGATTCTPSTGDCVTYTYDADGNLIQQVDNTGTYTLGYDQLNRRTSVALGSTWSTSATFDGPGNMLTYTDAGGTVNYKYDPANRLVALSEPGGPVPPTCTSTTFVAKCVAFTNNPNGFRTGTYYSSKESVTSTPDTSGRDTSVIAKRPSGATFLSRAYAYTNTAGADIALQRTVTDQAGNVTTYTYDAANRLTDAKTVNGGTTVSDYGYTYDGAGNRLTAKSSGTTTTTYTYNQWNELCWTVAGASANACASPPTGAVTYAAHSPTYFDADGNQTGSSAGQSLSYNTKNQSTSITPAGGSAVAMTYAGANQSERTAEGSTTFVNGLLGVDSQTTGSTSMYFTRDPSGNLISMRSGAGSGGTSYYYATDAMGSVMALTDNTGNTDVASYTYDPYGNALTATGTLATTNPYRFDSGYYDSAVKLYKFGARYYDPTNGRWTQLDPSSATPGYSYAGDNGVNYSDTSGLYMCASSVGSILGDEISLFGDVATFDVNAVITGNLQSGLGDDLSQTSNDLNTLQSEQGPNQGCTLQNRGSVWDIFNPFNW